MCGSSYGDGADEQTINTGMNQEQYVSVGYTGKPHGIQGALKLVVKERYERDVLQANVLFVKVKGKPLPFFVEDLSIGNAWIVKFEDINTPEIAAGLSGKDLLLRNQDLLSHENDPDAEPDYAFYIGYELVDAELGPIGLIEDVYDLGAHSLAGVRYKGREILVPLHRELVRAIHDDVRELVMNLPQGLLDL